MMKEVIKQLDKIGKKQKAQFKKYQNKLLPWEIVILGGGNLGVLLKFGLKIRLVPIFIYISFLFILCNILIEKQLISKSLVLQKSFLKNLTHLEKTNKAKWEIIKNKGTSFEKDSLKHKISKDIKDYSTSIMIIPQRSILTKMLKIFISIFGILVIKLIIQLVFPSFFGNISSNINEAINPSNFPLGLIFETKVFHPISFSADESGIWNIFLITLSFSVNLPIFIYTLVRFVRNSYGFINLIHHLTFSNNYLEILELNANNNQNKNNYKPDYYKPDYNKPNYNKSFQENKRLIGNFLIDFFIITFISASLISLLLTPLILPFLLLYLSPIIPQDYWRKIKKKKKSLFITLSVMYLILFFILGYLLISSHALIHFIEENPFLFLFFFKNPIYYIFTGLITSFLFFLTLRRFFTGKIRILDNSKRSKHVFRDYGLLNNKSSPLIRSFFIPCLIAVNLYLFIAILVSSKKILYRVFPTQLHIYLLYSCMISILFLISFQKVKSNISSQIKKNIHGWLKKNLNIQDGKIKEIYAKSSLKNHIEKNIDGHHVHGKHENPKLNNQKKDCQLKSFKNYSLSVEESLFHYWEINKAPYPNLIALSIGFLFSLFGLDRFHYLGMFLDLDFQLFEIVRIWFVMMYFLVGIAYGIWLYHTIFIPHMYWHIFWLPNQLADELKNPVFKMKNTKISNIISKTRKIVGKLQKFTICIFIGFCLIFFPYFMGIWQAILWLFFNLVLGTYLNHKLKWGMEKIMKKVKQTH